MLVAFGKPADAVPVPSPAPLRSDATLFLAQAHLRRINPPYLRRIADAGFGGARISLVPWWATSRHGGWVWTDYDAIYRWLVRRHLTPLFVLQNPRSEDDIGPTTEFARLAGARYPLALLELGNEPDNPAQWPGFYPPAAQKPLGAQEYWAIERRYAAAWREGNPRARIATGGTSGFDFAWQSELIAAIARDGAFGDGTVAAIAVHAYGEPLPPRSTRRAGFARDLARARAMVPIGIAVWVTEYGLIDPQPQDVTGWFTAAAALGVPVFSWYEIQDDVLDGQTERYGLLHVDGATKPAYDAARTFLRARPAPSATPTPGS